MWPDIHNTPFHILLVCFHWILAHIICSFFAHFSMHLFHTISFPISILPSYSSKQTLTKCPINLSNVAQGLGCIAVSTVENEAFPNCTLNPLFIFRVYFSILWISTDFNLPGSAVCGNMLGLWSRKIWVWIPALWSFWK